MLAPLGREIEHLDAKLAEFEVKLAAMHKANPLSQRLATIPGIGVITALTLTIEIDPMAFKSGRHLAAWIGLTPKDHSTTGKQYMGGISRAGNEQIGADGNEPFADVMTINRADDLDDIANLGLTVVDGKRVLAGLQQEIVAAQARSHSVQRARVPKL
jgi:hypothetical protein